MVAQRVYSIVTKYVVHFEGLMSELESGSVKTEQIATALRPYP